MGEPFSAQAISVLNLHALMSVLVALKIYSKNICISLFLHFYTYSKYLYRYPDREFQTLGFQNPITAANTLYELKRLKKGRLLKPLKIAL